MEMTRNTDGVVTGIESELDDIPVLDHLLTQFGPEYFLRAA